ncbi:MAG TPA: terminase [Xanthobacteraceae bacterium]|nr:terminase [Xanthobacteraceae bacterium]
MGLPAEFQRAKALLSDWRWRLDNLYWITDKEGREVRFRLNWAQSLLFESMHNLSLILKARQIGFSTFVVLFMLDACLFNRNVRCGIVDRSLDDAKKKLEKVKFAYRRLPVWLKMAVPIKTANVTTVEFANDSSIEVGTSHRGGTLQYLHISEYGQICARYPDKAQEIRTGALNTIQAGQVAIIESTAEGQDGDFYELCAAAQSKARLGAKLTPLDFKFFFFPWWRDPAYELTPEGVLIPEHFARYFAALESAEGMVGCQPVKGIFLTPRQKAWYVKKAETQQGQMKREYPSTPEEAFEAAVEGAIYGQQIEAAEREGRIGAYPAVPGVPVHTFWDIGRSAYTSIWFAQIFAGPRIRLVHFYQNALNAMPHYAAYCAKLFRERGWVHGEDWFPHDAKVEEWGSGRSRIEQLIGAGFKARLARELGVEDGINAARAVLGYCEFDAGECAEGLRMLRAYRYEWDDIRGAWKSSPRQTDTAAHGADAFRYLAVSFREIVPTIETRPPQTDLKFEVRDGRLRPNLSVREWAEIKRRKRLADE